MASHQGKMVPYGKFKHQMEKLNCFQYDGDGAWVSSYARSYAHTQWLVIFEVDKCDIFMSFDEEVILEKVTFHHKGETSPLGEVPRRLIAEISVFLNQLAS